MTIWRVCLAMALGIAGGAALRAQTVDFAVEQNGGFVPVPAGSTLSLQTTSVGAGVTVELRVRNTGVNRLRMQSIGTAAARFGVTAPAVPFELAPGASFQVTVAYTSANSARSSGELLFNYLDLVGGTTRLDRLGLAGVAPEFRYSYLFAAEGNQIALRSGGSIPFPSVSAGSTSTATVIAANIGSGPGTLDSVTIGGASFRVTGLPVLPVTIGAGTEFRFGAVFAPTAGGAFTGTLAVRGEAGNLEAALTGTALSPAFTFELILPDGAIALTPGQIAALPETAVGATLVSTVRVTNNGTSSGTITGVSVSGTSFALSDVPPLPAALAPQASLQFTLTSIPRESGRNTGTLRIGSDSFPLEILGLGARLTYRYTLAGADSAVLPGATIFFPQTAIGARSDVVFRIENGGNRDAVLTAINISQAGTSFSLVGAPPLPHSLPPGRNLQLTLGFTARAQGPQTGTLQINSDSLPLSGSGAPPPPLPSVTYSGVSGTVQPFQQPSVGMTLDQPYPVLLRGQLRLQFEATSFADDPSLQFASGGRVVDFQIPAGTLDALFSNGANRIRFQTGTVAGTISVVPSFSIDTFPITENLPSPLRLTLPPSAPQILTVQVASTAPGSVSFFVTGSTTTRALRSIEFVFQPTDTYRQALSSGTVTVNVEAQADTYFRSAASTGVGGLFLGTVPFLLSDGGLTPLTPSEVLQSVTVTVVSSLGRSNSETLSLR